MKKLILLTLSISLININNCFALDQSVLLLEKDIPAPYKGYLFPEEKVLQLRKDLLQLDTYKSLLDSYDRSILLYQNNELILNKKINLLLTQNDVLVQSAYNAQDRGNLENWIWFGLGMLVTGVGISIGLHNK